jgi:peptidyl-prolyl cis-trans isomerase SDCCAG10
MFDYFQCLSLLEKFRTRLLSIRERKGSESNDNFEGNDKDDWLSHEMHCQKDEECILAKDANIKNEEDWYDIYDPRNPINKRRREAGLAPNDSTGKKSRVK